MPAESEIRRIVILVFICHIINSFVFSGHSLAAPMPCYAKSFFPHPILTVSFYFSFTGFLDAETWFTYFNVQHLHVHGRPTVLSHTPTRLGGFWPENWICTAQGHRHIYMPSEYGAENQFGCFIARHRYAVLRFSISHAPPQNCSASESKRVSCRAVTRDPPRQEDNVLWASPRPPTKQHNSLVLHHVPGLVASSTPSPSHRWYSGTCHLIHNVTQSRTSEAESPSASTHAQNGIQECK